MGDRFAHLAHLPRPRDAVTMWVEMGPEAVHFLDAVFSAFDGIGNVRREYREQGATKLFKLYVAPGCVAEAERLLRSAARFVPIGEVWVEQ
ncbi:hypothetical protein H5T55_05160 [Candidatus Bipolaricaulota bacterium]|nr:hypothetical protein [Candidatus Bipolaricaulota bacterium]